jgi:hypothetical protein
MTSLRLRSARPCEHGYSLLELMITSGLVGMFFVTAAMIFRTVGQNRGQSVGYQRVTLGKGITNEFFRGVSLSDTDINGTSEKPAEIDVMAAPHYGTEYEVNVMREAFHEDVGKSCAVFALPRGPIQVDITSSANTRVANVNYIHPEITKDGSGNDVPPHLVLNAPLEEIDHPNAFLDLLLSLYPDAPNTPFPFIDRSTSTAINGYYRGTPGAPFVNASIYFIQPSHRTDALLVRSVWEIDFIRVESAVGTVTISAGVFASVRRY